MCELRGELKEEVVVVVAEHHKARASPRGAVAPASGALCRNRLVCARERVQRKMSWLAAKAEELLQSADKKAGAEIHKVKKNTCNKSCTHLQSNTYRIC